MKSYRNSTKTYTQIIPVQLFFNKGIQKVKMPKITDEQRTPLNADITDSEIQTTICALGAGKAPGPDGFSSEFYKSLRVQISPTLSHYFNILLCTGEIRPESKHAYIKVLPKPGKDLLSLGSEKYWRF